MLDDFPRIPRGVLISVSHILLLDGVKVKTFRDCDESYLEDKEVSVGDVVSFEYVGVTREEAAEIEKVTPTAKERELQQYAKGKTTAKHVQLTVSELRNALLNSGPVDPKVAEADLERAEQAVTDASADDAAAHFLMALPESSRPRFVFFEDYHLEASLIEDLGRAFGRGAKLAVEQLAQGRLQISFSRSGDKQPTTQTFADLLAALMWIQVLSEERDLANRLWFLPCHEGCAVLICHEADCKDLREAGIPVEHDAQL